MAKYWDPELVKQLFDRKGPALRTIKTGAYLQGNPTDEEVNHRLNKLLGLPNLHLFLSFTVERSEPIKCNIHLHPITPLGKHFAEFMAAYMQGEIDEPA